MTETIEIEQEITEKVLSHVSEAYGGFSTAEKAAEAGRQSESETRGSS